jgi:hypothetical protein
VKFGADGGDGGDALLDGAEEEPVLVRANTELLAEGEQHGARLGPLKRGFPEIEQEEKRGGGVAASQPVEHGLGCELPKHYAKTKVETEIGTKRKSGFSRTAPATLQKTPRIGGAPEGLAVSVWYRAESGDASEKAPIQLKM